MASPTPDQPLIRSGDYARLTGRSPQSASRDLAAAVRAGYLVGAGQTRSRVFLLGPRLLTVPAEAQAPPFPRPSRTPPPSDRRRFPDSPPDVHSTCKTSTLWAGAARPRRDLTLPGDIAQKA